MGECKAERGDDHADDVEPKEQWQRLGVGTHIAMSERPVPVAHVREEGCEYGGENLRRDGLIRYWTQRLSAKDVEHADINHICHRADGSELREFCAKS